MPRRKPILPRPWKWIAERVAAGHNRRMSSAPPAVPHPIDRIWSAPLVPLALAFTCGILLDRFFDVSPPLSLAVVLLAWLAWWVNRNGRGPFSGVVWLWVAVAAAGCWRHQYHFSGKSAQDIGGLAGPEGRVVWIEGTIASEPTPTPDRGEHPLRTFPAEPETRFLLECRRGRSGEAGRPTTGTVQVWLAGIHPDLRMGERLGLTGRLSRPSGPVNPGGFDQAAKLREEGIGGILVVAEVGGAVERLPPDGGFRLGDLVGSARVWARAALAQYVPVGEQGLAVALLLGDGSGLDEEGWNVFLRTGVIHVLAISGQHLMVLAGIAWLLLRMGEVSRRRSAGMVALLLGGYALVTGGRPPVLRATWMVAVVVLGIFRRHPVLPANAFALAWIGIGLVNPAHLFQFGCLLSFLAVAVLIWGTGRRERVEPDPLDRLERAQRSYLGRLVGDGLRRIGWFYLVNAAVWLAVTPLVASRQNLVAPVAILIGPPVVLASSIALVAGFVTLLAAPLAEPLAHLSGWLTGQALAGARGLAQWGADLPGAWFHVIDLPDWWLAVFYFGLFAALTIPTALRRWRWFLGAGSVWVGATAIWLFAWPHVREFRCTFLSVGHGGCIVLETPGGRTILYDAGAMTGPEVTRRHIAPFLWERGIRRLDEVLLSHADLDHFNGIPSLLDRVPVGRIGLTPSFSERATPGARLTLEAIGRRGTATRILQAGHVEEVDGVRLEVLHPPAQGPEGKENARSLVLAISFQGRTILLTGDLEEPGLSMVLRQVPPSVAVLQAPHHGSPDSNTEALAGWARARLAVSSQGKPRSTTVPRMYAKAGVVFWATWEKGAVTLRFQGELLTAESFRSGELLRLP